MANKWAKEIFERAKERQKADKRANYTFRLDEDLTERFRKKCEAAGLKMTHLFEDFMRQLLDKKS